MDNVLQAASFTVAGLTFGVSVKDVQEVFRYQEMTPVPLAPKSVRGLINLRGQIITAIDMRSRLGLPERPADKLPMNVIVRGSDGGVSLLVDEIGDVVEVDANSFEPPPESLDGGCKEVITGVYKLEKTLMLILDKDLLLAGVT